MSPVSTIAPAKAKAIGILGFDGVSALDLLAPLETFAAANRHAENETKAYYDVRIVGVAEKSFASETGVTFQANQKLSSALTVDTIVIPGGKGAVSGVVSRKIAEWLTVHAAKLRRIVGVSTGVYPLAQSGLIDGRKATTHWRFAADLANRFPNVRMDSAVSFTKDGSFYTCGAGTAATEITLALIEEDYGYPTALSVSRDLVMRLRPFGVRHSAVDPSQFEYGPMDRLADLPAWIVAHLHENLSVEVLAEKTCVCPRHFGRLFKSRFKTTPASYVERVRLDEARSRLRFTRNSVESIAHAVGFEYADSFRRAFQRRFKMSPLEYRKTAPSKQKKRYSSDLIAA